jgi:hypothetical protein
VKVTAAVVTKHFARLYVPKLHCWQVRAVNPSTPRFADLLDELSAIWVWHFLKILGTEINVEIAALHLL